VVDRVIGIAHAEVDAEAAGAELFEHRLDVVGQVGHEVLPAARRAGEVAGDAPGVEAVGHHPGEVGLEQLGDADAHADAPAQPLQA
jgi:hypothetical protein